MPSSLSGSVMLAPIYHTTGHHIMEDPHFQNLKSPILDNNPDTQMPKPCLQNELARQMRSHNDTAKCFLRMLCLQTQGLNFAILPPDYFWEKKKVLKQFQDRAGQH
jgi:hypothetical protein